MAARRASGKLKDGVFWSAPGTNKESIVPGVNDVHNLRPKVKGGRTKEVKASIPVVQSVVQVLDPHTSLSTNTDLSTVLSNSQSNLQGKQISLRDLCVEDKKRVAILIKELAKLGEEKENAEKNLEEERKHYEEQILKLVEQQEQILKEREEVQNRLHEYEAYILKLQQEQQFKELQQQQQLDALLTEGHQRNNSLGRNLVLHTHPNYADAPAAQENEDKTFKSPRRVLKPLDMEESHFGDCSTQALPSNSWTENHHHQRSFTEKIDKELEHQNQILAASILSRNSTPRNQSATNSPRGLNKPRVAELQSYASYLPHDQSQKNLGDKVYQQDHFRQVTLIDQQYGNTDLLTPEKNDLIHRLIKSQSKFVPVEEEQDEVNTNRKGVKKTKHKKRPPPSYGPLQAPIMSSTQKSSEFGEEVDSVLTMEPGYPDKMLPLLGNVDENSNNNSDDKALGAGDPGPSVKKISHTNPAKPHATKPKPEDRSLKDKEIERLQQAGIDQEFLRKYKKMSPAERKQELLRQRAMLLEEQNRLKILLAEQEAQLKSKRKESLKAGALENLPGPNGKKQQNLTVPGSRGEQVDKETVKENGQSRQMPGRSPCTQDLKGLNNSNTDTPANEHEQSPDDAPVKRLDGRDGDECIVYSDWPAEEVARRLDYSQSSDNESNGSSLKRKSSKEAAANDRKASVHYSQTDKATSISYIHVPRMGFESDSKQSPSADIIATSSSPQGTRSETGKSSKKTDSSIGEKTLSVLEIINTLSQEEVPARHLSDRNVASGSSEAGSVKLGSNKQAAEAVRRLKTLPSDSPSNRLSVKSLDGDPNLSLFVLGRNSSEAWARRNLVSKYKAPLSNFHTQKLDPFSPVSDEDDMLGKEVVLGSSKLNSSLSKNFRPSDLDDELANVMDAIDILDDDDGSSSGKGQDLEDDLAELEESQILEEVFFI